VSRPVVESDAEPGSLDSAVASIIGGFRACPVPDNRFLGGLPTDKFPGSRRVEFPGSREKSREFLGFNRSLRKSVSKTCVIPGICALIPYAIEQGINSREQGINSVILDRSREFRAKPIRATRRISSDTFAALPRRVIRANARIQVTTTLSG
jgi:hypothetical protein